MNIFNKFSKTDLKKKIIKIKKDIELTIPEFFNGSFSVVFYGSYEINPKYLVFWICVNTDYEKEQLKNNSKLNQNLRKILIDNNYPIEAVDDVFIGFESEETVLRESDGDWHIHFK
jgi:hypothetical protein